jgi:uncharacterized protein YecT (DUF1311 family)
LKFAAVIVFSPSDHGNGIRMPRHGQFRRSPLLAAALLASVWLPAVEAAAACTHPRSPAYEACVATANGVTAAMRRCANDELERQTARWQRALQAIVNSTRISADRKNEIEAAEKAWEASRNRGCVAAARHEAGGGTLAPLLATDCAVCETAARADQLEAVARQ